jgi:hypothetical protein
VRKDAATGKTTYGDDTIVRMKAAAQKPLIAGN